MEKEIKKQFRSRIHWKLVGIAALFLIALAYSFPGHYNRLVGAVHAKTGISLPTLTERPFQFGLDLQGGVQLMYDTDTSRIAPSEQAGAVDGVRDVIERRVNALGVSEPVVQTNKSGSKYRIIVELPGVTDIKEALRVIGETPTLDFKEQNTEPPRELTDEERKDMEQYNKDAVKRAKELLNDPTDFAELAKKTSEDFSTRETGGSLGYVGPDNPSYRDLYAWAFGRSTGEKGLVENESGWSIVRIGGKQEGAQRVKARHILVCYVGSATKNCESKLNKEEALKKAEELKQQAKPLNFAALAREFSDENGAQERGGDLGWFGQGAFVPAFETAAFALGKDEISDPVETEFGYHLIYREDSTKEEYLLSHILVSRRKPEDIVPPQEEWKSTGLTGSYLKNARVNFDQYTGAAEVVVVFNSEGKDLFADVTKRNLKKPVAIFLDGQPISIPVVQTEITQGEAIISGNFTLEEARVLAQRLNAGALPVPVTLVGQQSIGASLGQEALQRSLVAGAVAALAVALFMMLYYRLPGFLASIALIIYMALVLAVFKLIPVTLTLAGIAGFVLSVGMAVGANILIFERLKEELREGKHLKSATEEGFKRAWTSIRDSNISALITCVLLWWFGTSIVRGFAVTLAIGVLLSMFSAIVITKAFMQFVEPWVATGAHWLFLGRKKT